MTDLRIPESLLPKGITSPAAFIADKEPDLPDYGVATGDLVVVDTAAEYVDGELSTFISAGGRYRLSTEPVDNHTHFGKVVMVVKYYGNSPFWGKRFYFFPLFCCQYKNNPAELLPDGLRY